MHSNKAMENDSITSFKLCTSMSLQIYVGTFFLRIDVDLHNVCSIIAQCDRSSHSHIMCSHMCNHGNEEESTETAQVHTV